jgi:uncharacterized protein YcgI (DUF1989 family)
VAEHILRGGQAMVVELPPGMRIRIVDTVGGQIGAMMEFAEADPNRGFSMAASLALGALNRSLDSDTSVALIEDDVVTNRVGEELLRVAGDTMPGGVSATSIPASAMRNRIETNRTSAVSAPCCMRLRREFRSLRLRGQPARSMRSTCLARRRTCRSTA